MFKIKSNFKHLKSKVLKINNLPKSKPNRNNLIRIKIVYLGYYHKKVLFHSFTILKGSQYDKNYDKNKKLPNNLN